MHMTSKYFTIKIIQIQRGYNRTRAARIQLEEEKTNYHAKASNERMTCYTCRMVRPRESPNMNGLNSRPISLSFFF
jgi:hypothetical protein